MTALRILVVDDHPMVRRGIVSLINASKGMTCIGEASNGLEAIKACQQTEVDIVLMDLIMPQLDGVGATRAIMEAYPQIRVLILTSFHEQDQVHNALRAGALGYLLKTTSAEELIAAIHAAHSGKRTLAPEATEALVKSTQALEIGQDLTARERNMLTLLTQGLSNQQIADTLSISLATVKFHVTNVLSKLGVDSRTEAVLLALKHKLVPPV
jgi:two-component system, NarL family, response regulator LiaR